jgi:exodeoxyribonuclease-3
VKIATFNVNSIRKRLSTVTRWLNSHAPDVLCLQETKVQDSEFPLEALEATGYVVTFRGMKGYNGVAVLTKTTPEFTSNGLDKGPNADGPRLLQVVFQGVTIVNTYVPQGFQIDHPKYQYKLEWFGRLRRYFSRHFSPDQSIIWCGDMNVAPLPVDVHHPEKHLMHVCYHQDAREAYQKTMSWGFEDVFRLLYPDRQQYTFWDYRQPDALKANRGWRIDHILATKSLARKCTEVDVDVNPRKGKSPSDHTVLWAKFSI